MSRMRTGLSLALICALMGTGAVWATQRDSFAADRAAPEVPPLREQLDTMILEFQALIGQAPIHEECIRILEDARIQLGQVPDYEFELVDRQLAGRVAEMLNAIRAMEHAMAAEPEQPATKSPGLPDAPYPDVDWDFFIRAYGDVNELPEPPVGGGSTTKEGWCSFAGAPTANKQFLQMNLAIVVEAVRDSAARLCDWIEDDNLGLGLACIITDVLHAIEQGIVRNQKLCADLMTEAEVTAAYKRAGHLHGDLVAVEQHLTTELNAAETAMGLALDANRLLLVDLDDDLQAHDGELTRRADIIDDLLADQQQFLVEYREENLRNHIEARLSESDHKPIAFFLLPEAHGGRLEFVRDVVEDTLNDARADGRNVNQAENLFQQAESARASGAYKQAYELYGRSYRSAL